MCSANDCNSSVSEIQCFSKYNAAQLIYYITPNSTLSNSFVKKQFLTVQ